MKHAITWLVAAAAALALTGPARGDFMVDMGSNNTGELQTGWESMSDGGTNNETRMQTFVGDYFGLGSESITVSLSSVDKRDRGDIPAADPHPLAAVLVDAFKENTDVVTLTLGGLKAGTYTITTWHHDANDGGDATFDVGGGSILGTAPTGIAVTSGSADNLLTPGEATWNFVADGVNDTVFTFSRTSGGEFFLNGFVVVPEPATMAVLAMGALAVIRRRRAR